MLLFFSFVALALVRLLLLASFSLFFSSLLGSFLLALAATFTAIDFQTRAAMMTTIIK
jgi:hypothetical protein